VIPADRAVPRTAVYDEVHSERNRAHAKHGAAGNSRENTPWDNAEWLPILVEELGEVAHEMTYDVASQGKMDRMRRELIQVAAMACAWIDALDEGYERK